MKIDPNKLYKITKITHLDEAPEASDIQDFRESGIKSPNVGYWIVGYPINIPTIGDIFAVARTIRNGVKCSGIFTSSIVTGFDICGDGNNAMAFVKTQNSVYKIENYE